MLEEPYFVLLTVPTATVQPTVVPEPVVSSSVQPVIENEETVHQDPIETTDVQEEPQQPQLQEAPVDEVPRRSQRVRKPAIPDDYEVYNCEEIHIEGDPSSYEEATSRPDASKWQEAMEDEMKSMSTNRVWDLEEIPKKAKTVGCKWVCKIKYDSKGNIEKYKGRLVAKGYTQREGIDYNETFSPVSCKDSCRIIMALVAHYDLELHQIDVKMAFLNGDLYEDVYMTQPKGFVVKGKEHMGCRLRKSIYGLKQASRQWNLQFDETITKFGFKPNVEDNCVYAKFKNEKFIFLILYVDDILLANSDVRLLQETKQFLSSKFDMKDLGEASYVLGIEIHRDRRKGS
jgi:hypothetical protein